jgi:flagellin-like hook-associated protein FlgL
MPIELATIDDLNQAVATLNTRITQMAEATQQDIDNLTTQVSQIATDLGTAQTKLQAEIDSLSAGGVDVTNLQAAIAPLDAAVQALGALQPTPPPSA